MTMEIKFDEKGLVPAIAQEARTGAVLMQAYMNQEAYDKTLKTGYAHYYSRFRKQLWKKGETSGNIQKVVSVSLDCDGDCVLLQVEQTGGACHTGEYSCFFNLVQENAKVAKMCIRDRFTGLLEKMADGDSELITIYYGENADKDQAEELEALCTGTFENCDVEVHYGGQPVYPYIISVE